MNCYYYYCIWNSHPKICNFYLIIFDENYLSFLLLRVNVPDFELEVLNTICLSLMTILIQIPHLIHLLVLKNQEGKICGSVYHRCSVDSFDPFQEYFISNLLTRQRSLLEMLFHPFILFQWFIVLSRTQKEEFRSPQPLQYNQTTNSQLQNYIFYY